MDLLGWMVGNREIQIDPNKIVGLKMWPTKLMTYKQAQVTMGLMNYIRPAIKGYAEMARLITEAMKKKNLPFKWTRECKRALEQLIEIATSELVLKCPDPEKPFKLEVDASAFAVGAVLIQQDKQGRRRHAGYFSKTLNETERNYDIWDHEFMAVILALRFWRHLLQGSPHKVVILTDHANLQYYHHPQKINCRVARYIATLADFNLELKHLPRIKNCADPLSRRLDYDDRSNDNEQVTALPDTLFTKVIETTALDQQIQKRQDSEVIEQWERSEEHTSELQSP